MGSLEGVPHRPEDHSDESAVDGLDVRKVLVRGAREHGYGRYVRPGCEPRDQRSLSISTTER